MKRILGFLFAALLLVGCNKTDDAQLGPNPEPKKYVVSLGVGAEGLSDGGDTPMNGRTAATATDDLYGINVYARRKAAEGITPYNWSNYAYGLFDQKDSISIELLDGYEYNFEATLVKDGKNVIRNTDYGNGVYSYSYPFYVTGSPSGYARMSNTFTYTQNNYLYMWYGYVDMRYTNDQGQEGWSNFVRPFVNRYYGGHFSFVPSENNRSLTLPLYRAVFGVKYQVQGLNEGQVVVQMSESPNIYLDTQQTEVQKTVGFYYTYNVLTHGYYLGYGGSHNYSPYSGPAPLNDTYSEQVTVSAYLKRPNGVVVPIGSKNMTFTRKRLKTITINVANTGSGGNGNIQITEEEGDLIEDGSDEI